jgi:chaperonin GroEL (HSP60 family)
MACKQLLFNSAAREKVLRGATVLADAARVTLGPKSKTDLGRAKRVVMTRETTTIIEGAGDHAAIQGRCDQIHTQIKDTTSDYDREKLEERLAKLAGGVVVEKMRSGTGNYGLDAARGRYVDLAEAGIIDPTTVVRLALENAVSVASVLLLTEATLTEVPEPKKKEGAGGMEGLGE